MVLPFLIKPLAKFQIFSMVSLKLLVPCPLCWPRERSCSWSEPPDLRCSLHCGGSLRLWGGSNLTLLFQDDQGIKQVAIGLIQSFPSLVVGYLSPFPQLLNLFPSLSISMVILLSGIDSL